MMKPGDMIEWVFEDSGEEIYSDHMLWSTPLEEYVPVDGIALLISITKDTYMWLNDKGLFHAYKCDKTTLLDVAMTRPIVPKVKT